MEKDLRSLRDQPFRLLQALAEQMRATSSGPGGANADNIWVGLSFRLAGRWFVTPRGDISEILRPMAFARIPGARAWLRGLANVRGNLLPLIDCARFAGLDPTPVTRSTRILVFSDERLPAGFIVDEVGGFRRFETQDQRHELLDEEESPVSSYLLGFLVREGRTWPAFSFSKLAHDPAFRSAGI